MSQAKNQPPLQPCMKYQGVKIYQQCEGTQIQVGHIIIEDGRYGRSVHTIVRVTKTMAITKRGLRFPRMYQGYFKTLPKSDWDATQYTLYAPNESGNE